MMRSSTVRGAAALGVLAMLGCGGHDPGAVDAAPPTDAGAADAAPVLDDFPRRAPMTRSVSCGDSTLEFDDADWFCRIPLPAASIDLYVQATPTDCETVGLSETARYETHAWVKLDGVGDALPVSASYQWGGNHHNDSLGFSYAGQIYGLWHSSIGFGFRVCEPVDCLLTCDAGSSIELCDYTADGDGDGCARAAGAPAPPAPVLCAPMNADGSLPTLTDPWTDDPPRLPCAGDQ